MASSGTPGRSCSIQTLTAAWPTIYAMQLKMKAINLTEGVDPTAPTTFREHGGALWFKGKGPDRHALDPSRREVAAETGGAD